MCLFLHQTRKPGHNSVYKRIYTAFIGFIFAKKMYILIKGDFMAINYSLIGKRIAARRRQLKMTQADLAEKTELTSKYISNIETSHSIPSIQSIMQLCVALDINPDFLLFGITDEKSAKKIDKINHLLHACTAHQLDKVMEYIEFLTNK